MMGSGTAVSAAVVLVASATAAAVSIRQRPLGSELVFGLRAWTFSGCLFILILSLAKWMPSYVGDLGKILSLQSFGTGTWALTIWMYASFLIPAFRVLFGVFAARSR